MGGDHSPKPVIQKFQAETGIHVNYTVFDSPDTAETTLSAGASNYDIVTMNAVPHLAREIPQGFWKTLDRAQIPMRRTPTRTSCATCSRSTRAMRMRCRGCGGRPG